MPNQPTSFRFPFNLNGKVHPEAEAAIRYAFSGLKDLNDAIRAITPKVNANTAKVTTISQTVAPSGGGGGGGGTPTFGMVNLQPNLTPGAYTTAQSDLAGLILVQSGISFALTLNSGLVLPFYTFVYNLGSGDVTMTPSLGNINNLGSIVLATGQMGLVYFDGTNWWAIIYPPIIDGVSITGNTAGAPALISSGTVVLAGGNNITLSQNGQSITISGASSGAVVSGVGISGGNTSNISGSSTGTIYLQGGNNVTLSGTGSTIVVSAAATAAAATQSLSGGGTSVTGTGVSFALFGGNNISLASASGAASLSLTINASSNALANVSLLNGSSGALSVSAGANIGIGQAANTITISANVPAATNFSLNGSSSSVTLVAGNNITLTTGASSITISAANSGTVVSGVGISGGNTSNISGSSTGTVYLQGGNNITLSGTGSTIIISGPNTAASGTVVSALGISGGNTSNISGSSTGTIYLQGGNNITLSGTGSTIVVSAGSAAAGTQSLSAGANSVTGTGVSLALVAGNNISLATATAAGALTATISAISGTPAFHWLVPPGPAPGPGFLAVNASQRFWPFPVEGYIQGATANFFGAISFQTSATTGSTGSGSVSFSIGIFTRNVSTLSTATSGSSLYTWSYNTSTGLTQSSSGTRMFSVPLAASFTPGDYWIGANVNTSSGGQLSFAMSVLSLAAFVAFQGPFGASSGALGTAQPIPGWGAYSVTSTAFRSSVSIGDIIAGNSVPQVFNYPLVALINSTF